MNREERNEYRRNYYHRQVSAFFADKSCQECGSAEKLRLRYLGEGALNISNVWSWNRARRGAILAQCQVLCARCWRHSCCQTKPGQQKLDALLHKAWMRNWRRYRWILRKQGLRTPVAAPTEDYVKMVLEVVATL